jgi:hypothetical protein
MRSRVRDAGIFAVSLRADDRIPVRVVVVTTFQAGSDTDPTAGEFGNWVLNLPLPLNHIVPHYDTMYQTLSE